MRVPVAADSAPIGFRGLGPSRPMNHSQQWQGVPALIDRLIETADVGHRDRMMLEAVVSQSWVQAAALWRPGSDGPEFGARWHPVLSRGPAERLPEREAIHTVVHGERPGDFYPGALVLQAGHGRGAFAVAVVCDDAPAGECDVLEALLCLFTALDGDESAGSGLDPWIPLLPAEDGQRVEHDLRNLLTGIEATQDLLASYGDDLSAEELKHFSALIDEECTRAGDLLGHALGQAAFGARGAGCKPVELLGRVIAELRDSEGAELLLEAAGEDLHAIETTLEPEALHELLRGLLVELRANCAQLRLRIESHSDESNALWVHLSRESDPTGDAEPLIRSAYEIALRRHGVDVENDGQSWRLGFPARRCA